MSEKIEITTYELYSLVMPALNICTALKLRVQNHACCFELAASEAEASLNKLLSISKGVNKNV